MGTTIRPEVSVKNKYWIDKHRHYELKHFCLQYPRWKKLYIYLDNKTTISPKLYEVKGNNGKVDMTARIAIDKAYYLEKIDLIEETAMETDSSLYPYILKGITEGLSYTYLKTKMNMPCGKDMYYDRYRKFFWLLNNKRN
jgi:hypothetical protein